MTYICKYSILFVFKDKKLDIEWNKSYIRKRTDKISYSLSKVVPQSKNVLTVKGILIQVLNR